MIWIVNWLLTRKCNLKCDYCGIVRNSSNPSYPLLQHYFQNEMTTDYIIQVLDKIRKHNKDAFHIFYGGEPFLRNDLPEIISFCHDNNINYTIITNNTDEVQPKIKQLISSVGYLKGLTSSVDPVVVCEKESDDRVRKSKAALKRLSSFSTSVEDLVAEITLTKQDLTNVADLVQLLTEQNIYSSITTVDISKNSYYDFSNVTDENVLLDPTDESVSKLFKQLVHSDYLIHMKEVILPWLFSILPSNLDCDIDLHVHNVTIDADGSLRLCLRIRGVHTPTCMADNMFDSSYNVTKEVKDKIRIDKKLYCQKCNHTCLMMSKFIDIQPNKLQQLIHERT